MLNFVDRSNEADGRVYEPLEQMFKLFEGVFGASDEPLGAIRSVVDVERRIGEIYLTCCTIEDIRASFEQLQLDLPVEVDGAMMRTRQVLLESFGDEVNERVRLRAAQGAEARNRFERMVMMRLTVAEPGDGIAFDGEDAFELPPAP